MRRKARAGAIVDQAGDSAEGDKLAEMLIPLTPKEAKERNLKFGGSGDGFKWSERGRHFTCKHWDEETRLCTNYEDRPDMCRGFPYGEPCEFGCSCTADHVRPSSAESDQ